MSAFESFSGKSPRASRLERTAVIPNRLILPIVNSYSRPVPVTLPGRTTLTYILVSLRIRKFPTKRLAGVRINAAKYLVDNGADISVWNRKNKFGWTPLMIARGHRPGNFRPSPKTIVAVEEVMRAGGVEIPPEMKREEDDERYRAP